MSAASNDRRIDYVEFVVTDIPRARIFYEQAFGWRMTDYGPEYCAFADGRLRERLVGEQTAAGLQARLAHWQAQE